MKGRKSLLPTATIPENVSVVCVADGDVVLSLRLALEPLLSHATVVNTNTNATVGTTPDPAMATRVGCYT